MNLDQTEIRNGYYWFFGAGLFAVALSIALFTVDETLSNSDSEKKLGEAIYDMRSAQTSFGTGSVDERLSVEHVVMTEKSVD